MRLIKTKYLNIYKILIKYKNIKQMDQSIEKYPKYYIAYFEQI